MPIPFRDLGDENTAGVVAFLRFIDEPGDRGIRGALFITSTRGEPLEFNFTRISLRPNVLWNDAQARRRALVSLSAALFESARHTPHVVLALAGETDLGVFTEGMEVQVPVGRVSLKDSGPIGEKDEAQRPSESAMVSWVNEPPLAGGVAAKAIEFMESRQMLGEPFDRALLGIQEAFQS